MSRPTAAPAYFPYAHMTLAEVDVCSSDQLDMSKPDSSTASLCNAVNGLPHKKGSAA